MICNAGISIRHGFTAITPEEFDRVMRVNLYGSFFASQQAARAMLASGAWRHHSVHRLDQRDRRLPLLR